jgi:hypothetical protein
MCCAGAAWGARSTLAVLRVPQVTWFRHVTAVLVNARRYILPPQRRRRRRSAVCIATYAHVWMRSTLLQHVNFRTTFAAGGERGVRIAPGERALFAR